MTICKAVFIGYWNVTDRQTDGRTDRQNCYIISRVSVLTRDQN